MRAPLRHLALGIAAAALLAALGCGSKFSLPTESKGGNVPPDKAYTYRALLGSFTDLTDVHITRSSGKQLLILAGAAPDARADCAEGPLPAGEALLYPIFARTGTPPLSVTFDGMWRPQLAAEGGGVLFIYDAGDTCLRSTQPDLAPHVYLYRIGTPSPVTSFSDTNWAEVRGIAASPDRTVYVSGTFRVLEPDEFGRRTLRFRDGIWRYREADGYAHRDFGWTVLEGSGTGFVSRQRGIAWGPSWDPHLWVADGEKQAIQKLRIETDSLSHGIYQFDGTTSGLRFQDPVDVAVDDSSYVHVVDRGSARVLRYFDAGFAAVYMQQVNLGILEGEPLLQAPVAAATLDTIVYVADPPNGAALRYERRRLCPTCW